MRSQCGLWVEGSGDRLPGPSFSALVSSCQGAGWPHTEGAHGRGLEPGSSQPDWQAQLRGGHGERGRVLRVHTSWACQSSSVGKEARARKIYKCSLKGTRDQIANICWIIKKTREFQKNIYFCLLTMPKHLTVWITTNCGKLLRDGNTRPPDLPPEKSVCG